MMQLISFAFEGSNQKKWQSQKITFAPAFTFIQGENGSGKTPIMRGIAYSLGYPIELPPDIRANTAKTVLTIKIGHNVFSFVRQIEDDFSIQITDSSGGIESFTKQDDFNDWLFKRFMWARPQVTTKKHSAAKIYLSQLMPLFWVSQSKGWTYTYKPLETQDFLRGQREEALRVLFDLPPRHPFDRSKAYEQKKKELATIEDLIEIKRNSLKRLQAELKDVSRLAEEKLVNEKQRVRAQIEIARKELSSLKQSTSYVDEELDQRRSQTYLLQDEMKNFQGRIRGLEIAYSELDGETEILESNEVANDEFREFCGVENCKLFEAARQSYGKRLLYLRDQLKDIRNSQNTLHTDLARVQQAYRQEVATIQDLESLRQRMMHETGTKTTLEAIDELSRRYTDLDQTLSRLRTLLSAKSDFAELVTEKAVLEDAVKELRPSGGRKDKSKLIDITKVFKECLLKWMTILKTPNMPSLSPVNIEEDFSITLKGEKFTEDSFQDGSTRARIVLSYYAAVLESSLVLKGKHPGVLLLDTPRQQEIHEDDLKAYFRELRKLVSDPKHTCQVVLAWKDPLIDTGPNDWQFRPTFEIDGESKFLGPMEYSIRL